MNEKMKKYNKKIIVLIGGAFSILLLFLLLCMPYIVDALYDCKSPSDFFIIDLSKSDILDYYAQLLSLISTIVLGVIAVVQTHRSQKKSDEINALQLSIAQRELEMKEKQQENDINKVNEILLPKFEIRIVGYGGCYSRLDLEIKNISEFLISDFRSISFEVVKSEIDIDLITKWEIKFRSLASMESKTLRMYTKEMYNRDNKNNQVQYWENVKLVWKFSCRDSKGREHFYSTSVNIPTTKDFEADYLEVSRIG